MKFRVKKSLAKSRIKDNRVETTKKVDPKRKKTNEDEDLEREGEGVKGDPEQKPEEDPVAVELAILAATEGEGIRNVEESQDPALTAMNLQIQQIQKHDSQQDSSSSCKTNDSEKQLPYGTRKPTTTSNPVVPNLGPISKSNASALTLSKSNLESCVSRPKKHHASAKPIGTKKKPPYSKCFQSLRALCRMGFLPLASHVDDYWLAKAASFIQEYAFNAPLSDVDPFIDVKLEGKIPITRNELWVPSGYLQTLDQSNACLNEIASQARGQMFQCAVKLFGSCENQVRLFNLFDIRFWCTNYQLRSLLFKSRNLLGNAFPDLKTREEKWTTIDFKRRAEIGVDLMAVVFAGIVSVLKKTWRGQLPKKLLYPNLLKRMREIGEPEISEAWCRVLLFSCPAQDGDEVDNVYRRLFEVGRNLEHTCMTILRYVTESDPLEGEYLRQGQKQNASQIMSSKTIYSEKNEPYPWNRVVYWAETMKAQIITKELEGKEITEVVQSHQRYMDVIESGREILREKVTKVHLGENVGSLSLDKLVEIIVSRCREGVGAFGDKQDTSEQQQQKPYASKLFLCKENLDF